MSNKTKLVARPDKTHGMVQRDVTLAYELEMQKRYGFSWRRIVRELAKQANDKPAPDDNGLVETVKPSI